jgi:hypothetical protein
MLFLEVNEFAFLAAKKHVCMISTMKLVNHGKTIFTGAEPN